MDILGYPLKRFLGTWMTSALKGAVWSLRVTSRYMPRFLNDSWKFLTKVYAPHFLSNFECVNVFSRCSPRIEESANFKTGLRGRPNVLLKEFLRYAKKFQCRFLERLSLRFWHMFPSKPVSGCWNVHSASTSFNKTPEHTAIEYQRS